MVRNFVPLVVALFALWFATALAEEEPKEQLRPLAWLVGDWEGRGKYGEEDFVETSSYEWSHNRNFMKWSAEARMKDQVVHSETGMMGWDEAKKRLIWFSFAMDGTIGQAEDQGSIEKDTWVALGNVGDKPPWKDMRQILRKVDADTFTSEVQTKNDGQYVTFFKGTYKRKKKE